MLFFFSPLRQVSKGAHSRIKQKFQQELLPAMREVLGSAQLYLSECNSTIEFIQKTIAALSCREHVIRIINETGMFFDDSVEFDTNPDLFQLSNCILDLKTNSFRRGLPSDMCRRASPVQIPEEWLRNPQKLQDESAEARQQAWRIMWSIFNRVGEHHPDDMVGELGDQDGANFLFLTKVMARLLEGRPLCKCVFLTSKRGRNSKGLLEKIFRSLWGEYYVPVKPTVFFPDRRNENEHSSADIFRQGARVGFANEVSETRWSNAVFKNKNSTDPIMARACSGTETVRVTPTLTYVFATNDPPRV